MRISTILLLLACFYFVVHVKAQPFYFRHYEVEDGLSNNTVISALQDRYGFIWLGTSEGLNRFDGNSFKIYRHQANNPQSLKSNSVYCLYEDKKGNLWVGTEKGIAAYDADLDQFLHPILMEDGPVRSICEDTEGLLWFIFRDQLYYYKPAEKKLFKKYIPGIEQVSVITRDPGGGVWAGSVEGAVVYIHHKNATIYPLLSRSQNSIEALSLSKNNRLFIGSSREGLLELDLATKKVRQLIRDKNNRQTIFVRNILQASDTSIFISTEDGLYIYNPANGKYQSMHKDPMNPFSLSDNALYALCKDREGGIWVGSYFGGVNYLPNAALAFEKYFPTADPHSLSGNAVREITKDHYGRLWIGSEDGGLTIYDPQKNVFTRHTPNAENGLSSTNVHGLLAIGNQLLVGTFEHGLDIMNIPGGKVSRHFSAGTGPYDLKSNFINKILQTANGSILVCTAHGVFHFDIKRERFYPVRALPGDAFYSAITQDKKGTVWIGTHNKGLFYINNKDTLSFKSDADKENRLGRTRILYLMADPDDHLWVCTIDGLFYIDLKNKTLQHYSQDEGLPSNIIYSIIKDNSGNFWIPTSRGLALMEAATKKIKIFRQYNGLLNNQFNYQSAFKDTSGQIYLGSIKGLIRFNPALHRPAQYIPLLYITGLQQLGAAAVAGAKDDIPLINKNRITLAYNQATFNIDYVALNYTDPINIEYAYQINKGGWYPVGNSRKITFTNLPPGKYNISVRSTNNDGEWMLNSKTLFIEILPPFWKSQLAYFLYIALTIASIMAILHYYTRRQKEKQLYKMNVFKLTKEKELYQSKMDFFTNITHEIKTPLTLIKLPLERITAALSNTPQLHQYLQIMNSNTERLLALTHQLLDFRKIETAHYQLFLTDIDIADITNDIVQTFSPAIAEKNITLLFDRQFEKTIIAADREALIKIISNLIDNAIKYCERSITINFETNHLLRLVTLRIANDGKTVPDNIRDHIFEPFVRPYHQGIGGSGIGLSLVNSLTLLHNGSLKYEAINNMNIFSVAFPLKTSSIDSNYPTNNEP
ncbi:ligand-binding sensor domain-containing protein [Niabella sp. CJ426]|uniref:ligand-binding sensor domain-containing protein n=1 Tax=Niabella sp. CJ426 TaxID=3393740 RepID=UPI003D0231A7